MKLHTKEGRDRLEKLGVLKESDMAARWDMALKTELIEDRLEHRASLNQLKNKGVYQARHDLNTNHIIRCFDCPCFKSIFEDLRFEAWFESFFSTHVEAIFHFFQTCFF